MNTPGYNYVYDLVMKVMGCNYSSGKFYQAQMGSMQAHDTYV